MYDISTDTIIEGFDGIKGEETSGITRYIPIFIEGRGIILREGWHGRKYTI